MPFVKIEIMEGRTLEEKRQMVKEVTDAICRTLNYSPDAIFIRIADLSRENYARGGKLRVDQS